MDAPSPAKKQWTTGEKFLLVTIAVVAVLALIAALWFGERDANPTVVIPTPALPSPNAFDYFVAAGNAEVDKNKVDWAIGRTHHPAPSTPDDREYSLAEKEALVAENAPALRTLRRGFASPYQNPPMRSFSALFPYFAQFRSLARLTTLDAQAKSGRGDWAGAVQSNLDAVQMGGMIPHGSVLIGSLVGIACQAIGRRPVWPALDHLDAPAAERAARRLEAIRARHVPFSQTLQEEKWAAQAGLMEIFRKPNWRGSLKDIIGDDEGNGEARLLPVRLFFVSKRTIMDNYTRYMDATIANARRPYAARPPAPPLPSDPLNQILLPVFAQARLKDVDGEAQNALLTVALALRAYKLDHGAYPAALSALVPGYLAKVPDDPFALSGPLRYKRDGSSYALYSVGPDGQDDGTPIFDAAEHAPATGSTDRRYFANDNSRGDLVAGVNIY